MTRQAIVAAALATAMGLGGVALSPTAAADNIFRVMNPFNWFFGSDWDDDDDDYRHHRYGPYGWGGPYGWNGPWSGAGYASRPTVIVIAGQESPANGNTEIASVHVPE
jgi:hypothetical protein